jgi:Protein of unknown function (DUF3182)
MSAGAVVVYLSRLGGSMYTHERVVLSAVAEAIAEIKHYEFAGRFDDAERHAGSVFFVPDDTLIVDEAAYLGIRGPNDLYGGVVPYPFATTKAITHQLVDASADRPEGWSSAFAEKVQGVVLPGYTVFNLDDARVAARRLLNLGPIRIKEPLAAGGKGQAVAATIDKVKAFLETFDAAEIAVHGLVLESNLRDVTTVSIGEISIGDTTIAYHGKQTTVINNEGSSTYGGSDLVCVRGGWRALAELPMPGTVRLAAAQAKLYDAATSEYPGFAASRRNYDVAQGFDGKGRRRSGVLEASWRSGGASTVELAAMKEFAQDPALQVVEASSVKRYGWGEQAPSKAVVHYCGDDPEDGPIIRYTMITRRLRRSGLRSNTRRVATLETTSRF